MTLTFVFLLRAPLASSWGCHFSVARFRSCHVVYILYKTPKTNIILKNWQHNVLLVRGISSYYSAVCGFRFPDQSGKYTCPRCDVSVTRGPSCDHRRPVNGYSVVT